MKTTAQREILWIDLLRIIACFMVVLAHSCDPFVAKTDSNYIEFISGAIIGTSVRSCVPLFIMISGVLLIPTHLPLIDFYKKRLKRIIIPFIFWALMVPILYYIYFKTGFVTENLNIDITSYTSNTLLIKLYTWVFNFNYDIIPLWYIYMLIGLYLIIPIISSWIVQASQKELKTVIYLWLFSTLLPYIELIAPFLGYQGNGDNMGILGVCDWNSYGSFYYLSGFIGYLLLGYYLVKYPLKWSWNKTLLVSSLLFIVSYLITLYGFIWTQKNYPEEFSFLEIIWSFTSLNVAMMTFAIFIVFQKLKLDQSNKRKTVAGLTYSIFLCHFFFVQVAYDIIYPAVKIPAILQIIEIAIIAFLLSMGITWIMSKNKVTKRFIN